MHIQFEIDSDASDEERRVAARQIDARDREALEAAYLAGTLSPAVLAVDSGVVLTREELLGQDQ